ncbi:MAG: hypothetical protein R3C28_33020 [Pirellulaceae bacterium]
MLDWTGRQLRSKRGAIPDHLAPILERIGLDILLVRVGAEARALQASSRQRSSPADEAARRCIGYMHAPGANMMLPEDA